MLIRTVLTLLLAAGCAWPQAPSIPDTPVGHVLQAWLDAFNSGDHVKIQAFITKYNPRDDVDEMARLREQTGGFELLGIDKSDRLRIEFRLKEKAGSTISWGKIKLKDDGSGVIESFVMKSIAPGSGRQSIIN
jgi:hypothetical protein